MSICRWSQESSVYVYQSDDGLVCCGCACNKGDDMILATPHEMAEHLEAHIKAGDKVPAYAFTELDRLEQKGTHDEPT